MFKYSDFITVRLLPLLSIITSTEVTTKQETPQFSLMLTESMHFLFSEIVKPLPSPINLVSNKKKYVL
jgi:hypothetical protein